jgi:rod shape-determining protein MreD
MPRPDGRLAVPLSFLAGLLLTLCPLPMAAGPWRPDWLLMLCVFWAIHRPDTVGIWTAFLCGLMLDLIMNTRFGVHPLALVTAIWLVRRLTRRAFNASLPATLLMLAAAGLTELTIRLVLETVLSGRPLQSWLNLLPLAGSLLGWPWLVLALQRWGKN